MSDTIRECIIQDVIARLAGITVANGYSTGIGANVLRAKKVIDEDDIPSCNVWPRPETAQKRYGQDVCVMPILIEGIMEFGAENPSVISERILGDLKKAIGDPAWSRSPDYIDSIAYVSGGTENYPDEEDITVGATALFNVAYNTVAGDPYIQGG